MNIFKKCSNYFSIINKNHKNFLPNFPEFDLNFSNVDSSDEPQINLLKQKIQSKQSFEDKKSYTECLKMLIKYNIKKDNVRDFMIKQFKKQNFNTNFTEL